jgi:hypothetical protein
MIAARWARAREVLTWRHWAWATGLGVLLGILVPLQNLHLNFYFTPWKIVNVTPFYVAFAWAFLLAIAWAEVFAPAAKEVSLWRYFIGAIAASLVSVVLAASFYDLMRPAPRRVISGGSAMSLTTYSPRHQRNSAIFEMGFDGVVHGWLATFIYAGLRRSRRAARALADAEVGRSEAQRVFLAAQLLAVQAEVDPAFVMRRLDAIEAAYESDPAAADTRLDELIAFLRDAIPRLRSDPVT